MHAGSTLAFQAPGHIVYGFSHIFFAANVVDERLEWLWGLDQCIEGTQFVHGGGCPGDGLRGSSSGTLCKSSVA